MYYSTALVTRTYHIYTAGSFGEDYEMRHSQRSSNSHEIFEHILFLNLTH